MWKITRDLLNEKNPDMEQSEVGTVSPGWKDEKEAKCTEKFRMLDDDGEVYYEGIASPNAEFAPLDDFGMPNAGCVSIQYQKNGIWETL